MATALGIAQPIPTHDTKDDFACECGRRFSRQTDLDQHKSNNCKTRSISCSFCQQPQPSSTALSDHLMTCGNKTDQCPSCRKYIRRAVFAYHYENNCANLEETDTPPRRPRSSSTHRPSSKSNKSTSRENDINNHDQENYSAYNSSSYRTKTDKVSSATSSKRKSLNTIECEFCNNQCERSDYEAHKESCLKNPNNNLKPRQRTSSISKNTESRPSTSERRRSPNSVLIPCEFCDKQIDLRLWSTHVQDCREQETRRIEARAVTINREPVTEKLPCEHCEELFSVQRLRAHELICPENRENIARAAKLASRWPLTTVDLSNKYTKHERDLGLSSTYSSLPSSYMSAYNHSSRSRDILDQNNDREHTTTLQNQRFSSHLTIDTKRAQDSMRSRDNDTSAVIISRQKSPKQGTASRDLDSQLINSSSDVAAHDTLPLLSNDRLSSGTQSLPRKLRSAMSLDRQSENPRAMPRRTESPSIPDLRSQSTSNRLTNARGSHCSNATKPINRHLVNDDVIFHSPRNEDHNHQPKLNQRDRSTKNNNKSKLKTPVYNPPMTFAMKKNEHGF